MPDLCCCFFSENVTLDDLKEELKELTNWFHAGMYLDFKPSVLMNTLFNCRKIGKISIILYTHYCTNNIFLASRCMQVSILVRMAQSAGKCYWRQPVDLD